MTVISTRLGRVHGIEHDGILSFLGLRYALPPTGARRFAPPEPAGGWEGVYDATELPPVAPQVPGSVPELIGPEVFARQQDERQDEDCLFLNVFTPAADDRRRPVLFHIHGGGYTEGSGGIDGSTLAAQGDVVIVSINYRLGMLGFTDLSRLGDDFAGSASNGFRDQIAALRWVRDNIADYGGDPGNVTIFGVSAGGGSVLAMIAAPEADGLFHRGMAHSPGGVTTQAIDAVPVLCTALSVGEDGLLERLRTMTVDEFLAIQQIPGVAAGGVIDGVVVTRHPSRAIRDRGADGVPLLAGSTRDEGTLVTELIAEPSARKDATVSMAAVLLFGEDPSGYLDRLRATYPDADADAVHTLVWNDFFRRPSIHAVEAATEAGPGGWLYRFDLPTTAFDGRLGATHGSDVAFIFNAVGSSAAAPYLLRDPEDPTVRELAQLWSNTLIAFARTGDPNGAGLPDWPRYSSEGRACLLLDADSRVEHDVDVVHQRLWGDR